MINIIGNAIGAKTSGGAAANLAFEFTVDTTQTGTSAADQFTIPITSVTPYDISTSDGHNITGATGATTLTFSAPGTYTVSITDSCEGWRFANGGDKLKLLNISNWGVYANTVSSSFHGASNMTCSATDIPIGIHTNLASAFRDCTNFNGAIGNWDVSTVVGSASSCFSQCSSFNQPLNDWNVSGVTTFASMFYRAILFNQDLNNWDVSSTSSTGFNNMFTEARAFNGSLAGWTFPLVTSLAFMFDGVGTPMAFNNSSIAGWDVSNITSLSNTFRKCESFNVDLSSWNTVALTNMDQTFFSCGSFNQPLNSWDVSNVTKFSFCFYFATSFNQPLNNWNVSSCTRFNQMFFQATSFNQDIGNWNMSSAVSGDTFKEMFRNATAYDNGGQPINWITVAGPTDISQWFYNTPAFTQSLQSINITTAVNNLNFTYLSNITTANYDATLVAWESQLQAAYPGGVGYTPPLYTWQFSGATYSLGTAAEAARTSLVNTFGWTITDGGGVLTNESYLVASYNFDSNFTDYTGNHLLTATGSVTAGTAGGKVSNCSDFDGTTGYLTAADSDDFSFTNGVNDLPFSISFWFNLDSGTQANFVQKRNASSDFEWQIIGSTSTIFIDCFSNGVATDKLRKRYNTTFNTNTWYHFTGTYDGSGNHTGLKIYINGSLTAPLNQSSGTYVGMTNFVSNTWIGTQDGTLGMLNGQMDELHVWKNRELTAAEVTDIYNTENAGNSILPINYTTNLIASYNFDSNFTDYTGTNNGTAIGTPVAGNPGGIVGNDLLNNTTSYVTAGNNVSLQATTVSFSGWVKTNPAGQGGNVKGIIAKARAWGLYMLATGNLATYQWPSVGFIDTGVNIDDNSWHHVCMTMQDTVTNGSKIYIDGTLVSTFTYSISQQTVDLRIGGGEVTHQYINGEIDEVHVWTNRILSATEVLDIYNTENAGNSILP